MNDISELERRLSAALDRIRNGLGSALSASVPAQPAAGDMSEAEFADLREALDAEKTANAQLTERLRAVKEKHEAMIAALEKNVARLTQQVETTTRELNRQKRVNADLTETNAALSLAAREGVAEPHLLNRAMLSELEALRAQRSAEVAEMDEILSELKPLIGEVA